MREQVAAIGTARGIPDTKTKLLNGFGSAYTCGTVE